MKIRTDIHAGDALRDCQRQRDFWKGRAFAMEAIANGPRPVYPQPQPLPQPQPQPQPVPATGGWVGNVYYNDRSGWCG
jgi:hypothetical protein